MCVCVCVFVLCWTVHTQDQSSRMNVHLGIKKEGKKDIVGGLLDAAVRSWRFFFSRGKSKKGDTHTQLIALIIL